MSRKHESFSYYGCKYGPEQWKFFLNGKKINLPSEISHDLAYMIIIGKEKEAEDKLKRLLRKEEKEPNDLVTFAFFEKDSKKYYYTAEILAHRNSLEDMLYAYKRWKHYIIEDCNGMLQPISVTTGFVTPNSSKKGMKSNRNVIIDFSRRGHMVRFTKERLFA